MREFAVQTGSTALSYSQITLSYGDSFFAQQAAAANADFSKVQDFYLILTDQPGDKSWPITAATYMLMRTDYGADQNQPVLQFLDWCLKNGQEQAKALDYVPLPASVVKQIEDSWATDFKGPDGKPLWTAMNK